MLQLDNHQTGEPEADERLALPRAADRAEQVVGVHPGARNRRVTDPAWQLAADSTRRHRHRQPAVGVASDGANGVGAGQALLALAVVDEDRRVGHLEPVVPRETRRARP